VIVINVTIPIMQWV